MEKTINLQNQTVPYQIQASKKARRLRISVYRNLRVVVTLPVGFKISEAEKYLRQKLDWVKKSLNHFMKFPPAPIVKYGKKDYLQNKAAALALAKNKLGQFNKFYGFSYNRVSIKNQKTRWGSCSKKGNLNFNYKIVHLPENLVDYLVVHELCHLREMNHSRDFWALVEKTIPDYKILRRQLRNFGVAVS